MEAAVASELRKVAALYSKERLSAIAERKRKEEQLEGLTEPARPHAALRAAGKGAVSIPSAVAFTVPLASWLSANFPTKPTSQAQLEHAAHKLSGEVERIVPGIPKEEARRIARDIAEMHWRGPSAKTMEISKRLRALHPGPSYTEAVKAMTGGKAPTTAQRKQLMHLLGAGSHVEPATMEAAMAAGSAGREIPSVSRLYVKGLGKAVLRSAGIAAPFAALGAGLGIYGHMKKKKRLAEVTGQYKAAAEKQMPHFTEQDRPEKVKEIYRALKREHPSMPAEMKARIAARQGKAGKQKQGPPYKGEVTEGYTPAMQKKDAEKTAASKRKEAIEEWNPPRLFGKSGQGPRAGNPPKEGRGVPIMRRHRTGVKLKKRATIEKPQWTYPNEPLDSEKPIIVEKQASVREMLDKISGARILTLAERLAANKAARKIVSVPGKRTVEAIKGTPKPYGFTRGRKVLPKEAWMSGGDVL